MTTTLYPVERKDATLHNGVVTCKQGGKVSKFILGHSELSAEQVAELAEEIRNNPSMEAAVTVEAGIGDYATIQIPLWDYLTPQEKQRIRFAIKLYNLGDLAELKARENDINLNRIINKIHREALQTPREKRTTRKGVRYSTFGRERSNKLAFGSTMRAPEK